MENRDTNRMNMINAVIIYCLADTTSTAGITSFAGLVTSVQHKVVLVNGYNIIGGGTSKGVTLDTGGIRKAMQDIAFKCARATLAFANSTQNNTLKALVNFTETKLSGEKKEDIDDVCEGIENATTANLAGAMGFGVLTTDPTDLGLAIALYRIASQNPRQAVITRSQAKANASELIRSTIDDVMEAQMDPGVDTLKLTNNNFWSGYYQSRDIIDLGSTTGKVRGSVKDVNDVPLSNVHFSIFKTGTTTLVQMVVTDAKGVFNSSDLLGGDYDFSWVLATYVTHTETNVHLGPGKELQRKVVLVLA
jgi:hypothetical protein